MILWDIMGCDKGDLVSPSRSPQLCSLKGSSGGSSSQPLQCAVGAVCAVCAVCSACTGSSGGSAAEGPGSNGGLGGFHRERMCQLFGNLANGLARPPNEQSRGARQGVSNTGGL